MDARFELLGCGAEGGDAGGRGLFTADTGITVKINTVDHGTFQDQISPYLQGTPDDIWTWFSGFRMRFFADAGPRDGHHRRLGRDHADVRRSLQGGLTGNDGKQYFIPIYLYPWAVFYRKSLFTEKGYKIPKTFDELKTLSDKIQGDGLIPLAFGDKDGWPAMGTFDILNLRLNGYDFHIGLMAGKEKWTDPKVKTVFDTFKEFLPFHQEGAAGRIWQDAGDARPEAGGDVLPRDVHLAAVPEAGQADLDDLDFFPYPDFGTEFDGEKALDAPIDGFALSKAPKNLDAAKAFLEGLAQPATQVVWVTADKSNIAASKDADRVATRHSRRRPPRSSPAPSGSPSSSTATRTRTSPGRTACRPSCSTSSRTQVRTSPGCRRRSRTSGTPSRLARVGHLDSYRSWWTEHQSAFPRRSRPGSREGGGPVSEPRRGGRYSLLTRRDKWTLAAMVGIPLFFDLALIWGPTIVSMLLSFTKWDGIGAITESDIIGLKNYESLLTAYPFFWPALQHNIIWLAFLMFIATPDRDVPGGPARPGVARDAGLPGGLLPAGRPLTRRHRHHLESSICAGAGFHQQRPRQDGQQQPDRLVGQPSLNLWAALVATSWRHVGYIMVIYLAGLKSVDPALREAAKVDGATSARRSSMSSFRSWRRSTSSSSSSPSIEALRAFDLVYIINRGLNGLELLSTLITNNTSASPTVSASPRRSQSCCC